MAKVTITTNDGELIKQINVTEWNLARSAARAELLNDILEAVERAEL